MPDSSTFWHLKKYPARPYCWFWWLWKGYKVLIKTAGSGKWYTLHVQTAADGVFLLFDIKKSYVNAGMEKSKSGIGISCVQLLLKLPVHQTARVLLTRESYIWSHTFSENLVHFFILQEKLIAYRLIFQVYLNVYIFSGLCADII